jgi:hypothetical protein
MITAGTSERTRKRHLLNLCVLACSALLGSVTLGATGSAAWAAQAAPLSCGVVSDSAAAQSITLPSGCPNYYYVGSTDGPTMNSVSWHQALKVTPVTTSAVSISIGHATTPQASYTTASSNYGIAGLGVSGALRVIASAQNSETGPGCSGCGDTPVPGPGLTLSFSLSTAQTVYILIGGEGTGTLAPSGVTVTSLQNNTYSEGGGGVLASVGIFDASLAAGSYNLQFSSTTTLNNSVEALGAIAYEA